MFSLGAALCLVVVFSLFWFVKRAPHDTPLRRRLVVVVFTALVVVLAANSAAVLLSRTLEKKQDTLREELRQRDEIRKAGAERGRAGRLEEEEEQKERERERKQKIR